MIPNFTATVLDTNTLILTDTSDYEESTVTNRYWIITDVEGVVRLLPSPVINGLTIEVPMEKDSAVLVKLAFSYDPATDSSAYNKVKNVLFSPVIIDAIYDLRKKFVDLLLIDKPKDKVISLLNKLELIDAFSEAAIRLISTDMLAAQQALNMGNEQAKEFNLELC